MNGPQACGVALGGIIRVDDGGEVDEGLLVGMVGSEGDVVGGMPVLRGYLGYEWEGEERVDEWRNIATFINRECTVLRDLSVDSCMKYWIHKCRDLQVDRSLLEGRQLSELA